MNFIRRKDSAKDIDSCLLKSSSLQAEETVILNNGTFPKHRGQGNVLSGIGNHSYFLRNRVADIGNIYGGQGNNCYGTIHKASGQGTSAENQFHKLMKPL